MHNYTLHAVKICTSHLQKKELYGGIRFLFSVQMHLYFSLFMFSCIFCFLIHRDLVVGAGLKRAKKTVIPKECMLRIIFLIVVLRYCDHMLCQNILRFLNPHLRLGGYIIQGHNTIYVNIKNMGCSVRQKKIIIEKPKT